MGGDGPQSFYEFDPACEFCQIVRGHTPAEILWKDADHLAFFPINPAVPGHTLVIPTSHIPDYWALDEAGACRLALAVLRIGRGVRAALAPDGMNLITSAGEAAWQTVFHLHMHVVPRWHGDPIRRIWPDETDIEARRLEDIANRIRVALGT